MQVRELNHLRYIPIVLMAPVRILRLCPFLVSYVSSWTHNSFPFQSHGVFPLNLKWCLDNSITALVTAPVTQQDLASALTSALESSTVNPVTAAEDTSYRILLAEDNTVNQTIAVQMLQKHGNHNVEIADNGAIAVDKFKTRVRRGKPYDIVLVSVLFCHFAGRGGMLSVLMLGPSDGCVDAVHGWYGGHGVDSCLRGRE